MTSYCPVHEPDSSLESVTVSLCPELPPPSSFAGDTATGWIVVFAIRYGTATASTGSAVNPTKGGAAPAVLRASMDAHSVLAEFTGRDYSRSNLRIKRLIRQALSGSFRMCARSTPVVRVRSVPAAMAVRRKRAVIRADSGSGVPPIAFVIDSLCCACRSCHVVVNHPVTQGVGKVRVTVCRWHISWSAAV